MTQEEIVDILSESEIPLSAQQITELIEQARLEEKEFKVVMLGESVSEKECWLDGYTQAKADSDKLLDQLLNK